MLRLLARFPVVSNKPQILFFHQKSARQAPSVNSCDKSLRSKYRCLILLLLLLVQIPVSTYCSEWSTHPILFQGRFRPIVAYEKSTTISLDDPNFKVLPSAEDPGIWLPLSQLKVREDNFTLYPDPLFQEIRTEYLSSDPRLPTTLLKAYEPLAGSPYLVAFGKTLNYPTLNQLKAEAFYYNYPIIPLCIAVYLLALILFVVGYSGIALGVEVAAFTAHTTLLGLRIYILGRPPVANMFETILYVPWFAVMGSLLLSNRSERKWMLIASNCVAVALLSLLLATRMNIGMENVQAVLDSQYWLIVHVLLVVGSYGIFALAGVLGHLYFFMAHQKEVAKAILKALYLGTVMLIGGTLLGGVWAAQSWGRFWDWDPKESWAFISICIYIIGIHLYRFKRIRDKGLAMGSIIGLQAIAFTWYGVNYILGTGLHSYGFGNGGEHYFYSFVAIETLFLLWACFQIEKHPQVS